MDVSDLQATVTAGSCSSRVVFNVPKARSAGAEIELAMAPSKHFDFALSAGFNNSELRSTVTSTAADGSVSVVSGIEDGPADAERAAVPGGGRRHLPVADGPVAGLRERHVPAHRLAIHAGGRRRTRAMAPWTCSRSGPTRSAQPLTQSVFLFDPQMPAYDLVNLRLGVLRGKWDFSLYANNLTDELAFLALDRERGKRARVGYLTNQPRTFGVTARFKL